jgi:fumarate hydratase subunit beta
MRKIELPLSEDATRSLKAGEDILLSGVVYAARDQAHKRLSGLLASGEPLPFALEGSVVYYMGPAPAPPGFVIGSSGPTTAGRMDPFTPALIAAGLRGMIGKGMRSSEVVEAMKRHGAVYFYAFGGCGALYARHITKNELIAFPELGPEGIYRLTVKDFPVIVGIDAEGTSVIRG